MRFDLFIIWGNGMNYIPQIISEIRNNYNFSIVRLKYHEFDDVDEFIKNIYECKKVPMDQLMSKIKYLSKYPKVIMAVLVRNKNPKELELNNGGFKHLQCQNINKIKQIIRSKFNPLFIDTEKQIYPPQKGVPNENCIHATDYEEQTEYLLGFLKMESISFYKRFDHLSIEIPWHLSFYDGKLIRININSLKCHIINEGTKLLEESPHYQYVQGNKKNYIEYINNNIGVGLQDDHYPASFDNLINNFDVNYINNFSKKPYIIISLDNEIMDGLHRASILKSIGAEMITCLQVWAKE